MSGSDSVSESILASVAKHEGELLDRVRASEEEARRIVEQARSDAREYRQEREAGLAEEVARIRGESEEARQREFQATVSAAEGKLVDVREASFLRVPETSKEVLALFLPKVSGGTQS